MTAAADLPFEFTPVVILGAGRSGTNMLRDVLTTMPDIDTWPCDEIQPIWRHGHLDHPTDDFTAQMASPRIRAFIRRAFIRQWKARGRPAFLVEKTCANTLRVPFLAAILPEAHFITITRHPEDVVPSAKLRWEGKLEVPPLSYFAAKARFIPLMDVPRYGAGFVSNRIDKLRGRAKRLRVWGPIWDGLETHQHASLEEICARQWGACVGQTRVALDTVTQPVTATTYERFLADPEGETGRLLDAIGYGAARDALPQAVASVRRKDIGVGPRNALPPEIKTLLAPEAQAHGYEVN